MNLRCDVCDESDAAVLCSADEAALCSLCDGCVHHANKLACKHQRFSIVVHQAKDVPPCDTCEVIFVRRGELSCFVSRTEQSCAGSAICHYTWRISKGRSMTDLSSQLQKEQFWISLSQTLRISYRHHHRQ